MQLIVRAYGYKGVIKKLFNCCKQCVLGVAQGATPAVLPVPFIVEGVGSPPERHCLAYALTFLSSLGP